MRRLRSRPTIAPRSDGEALFRVAEGEVTAIGDVYDRHACALLEFASRIVGKNDAEDVVHTVFIRAASVAASYDNRSSTARAWLFGITSRVIQERRRSMARALRAMLRLHSSKQPLQMPPTGDRRDIARGLDTLSEVQRLVLLLSDVEGVKGDDIAKILDVPVGTVWTRLHHARRKLRAFLGEGR